MKIFSFLETSIDPEIVGVTDGLSQVFLSDESEARLPWLKQFMWLKPEETWPDLYINHINLYEGEIAFHIKKRAQLTDILEFSPFIYGAIIVSNKLRKILDNFMIAGAQFRKITIVLQNGNKLTDEYYLLQLPRVPNSEINWKKTHFYDIVQRNNVAGSGKYYFVSDEKEYLNSLTMGLTPASIEFKREQHSDLLYSLSLLVSSTLREELQRHHFSNVLFIDFDEIVNAHHASAR